MMPVPVLRDAKDDVRIAWGRAAARTIDAMHNNGWIAGVVEQMVSLMIGDGLRPNLKPDFSWAGWNAKQEGDWGRLAERRFQAWAGDKWACDAGGRYTLAQMQAASVRSWFGTGEGVAELPSIERPGIEWRTKLRLVPSHWLSQKSSPADRLDHGVYHDHHGAPAGYLFEMRGPYGERIEVRKAARDGYGRPMLLHVFDGQPGQVRGITPFAPILRVLRDYDQLSNATLSAAMIHAVFAATIESDAPSAEVLDALTPDTGPSGTPSNNATAFSTYLGEKAGWYENVDIDVGKGARLAHLFTGEHLKLHASEHPNSTYEPFANFLLREIARCAGGVFEDLTGDYRGATYSSVRMGIAKQWPLLLFRRRHVPVPVSQAALEAFLEEEVDSGALIVPGGIDAFVRHRAAICRAEWRGPAKPQADEVKAAKAHEMYRNMGVLTDEQICSDLGTDWEDVYYQRAFEQQTREELNVHGGITNGGTDIDDAEASVKQTEVE
ncbi:phage portal protein [Aurantimonas sp. 22II-16-19i]|uniref:phage portal protein n=1 Tax=Aurantimonas sp. 22II-16-19i TaxID=1317114 RepID=UPI0015932F9A|nr:phage portal protein [Aurantimonas sp. 22II-16-19i]